MAEEVAHRAQTRIQRSVRKARFPFLRAIEDFNFTFQTSVRLQLLGSYLGPELVSEGRSLILCGPSGTGKTHLAVAIAYRAIQNGFEAAFASAAALIESLSTATRRGTLASTLTLFTHPHVLVIDEVGYLSVGDDAANLLFQVVNDRYLHHRPMIFTTNKPLAAWGKVLHDPDLAEAILDRVLERGRVLELRGPSYRTPHLQLETEHRSPTGSPARISGKHRQPFPEPTRGVAAHMSEDAAGPACRCERNGLKIDQLGAVPIHFRQCQQSPGARQRASLDSGRGHRVTYLQLTQPDTERDIRETWRCFARDGAFPADAVPHHRFLLRAGHNPGSGKVDL
jgi:DNA replication protein DnaC